MSPAADRVEATAYARAMNDYCVALEVATAGAKSANGVKPVNPMKHAMKGETAHAG
jgi:hypothetical protein